MPPEAMTPLEDEPLVEEADDEEEYDTLGEAAYGEWPSEAASGIR